MRAGTSWLQAVGAEAQAGHWEECVSDGEAPLVHEGSPATSIFTGNNGYLCTISAALGGIMWCMNPCLTQYAVTDTPYTCVVNRGSKATDSSGANSNLQCQQVRKRFPDAQRGRPRGMQTAIAYCTVRGHWFEGEERVRVVWEHDSHGHVWFEVWSLSRGHGWWGAAIFPLMRRTQRRFFEDQVDAMVRLTAAAARFGTTSDAVR
ncbi:hypothetical protein JKP88DRAFT_200072 [Tribonema minus]|uniref:DUF1990 domain-containing protein n=1 Tax=Tribonema minus TaxID=303371 RepID=A0A835Z0Y9_9STRA|nr:hypothetical protein JKP88DRAFT_200072 [Tribonema minus]